MITEKTYKNCNKIRIGSSDCAKLHLVGWLRHGEIYNTDLYFGEDGVYFAYLIEDNAPVPEHYNLQYVFKGWVTIFNERGCTLDIRSNSGGLISFYRSGERGCIIKIRPVEPKIDQILRA